MRHWSRWGSKSGRYGRRGAFRRRSLRTRLDLDRSYYGGVERGERNIAALNLMRIAAALEVEVGELFPKVGGVPELAGERACRR